MSKFFLRLLSLSVSVQVLCKDNDSISPRDSPHIEAALSKTIKKINYFRNYEVCGHLVEYGKRNKFFTYVTISYNFETKEIENIEEIQGLIGHTGKGPSKEEVHLSIEVKKCVRLISKPITIEAHDKKPVTCYIKYKKLLPTIKTTYNIDEFPILKQLVSNSVSSQKIDYVVIKSRDQKITAVIFFNREQNTKQIENFLIVLLGEQQIEKKKYHIQNIIGLIFAIKGKVVGIDVSRISLDYRQIK